MPVPILPYGIKFSTARAFELSWDLNPKLWQFSRDHLSNQSYGATKFHLREVKLLSGLISLYFSGFVSDIKLLLILSASSEQLI